MARSPARFTAAVLIYICISTAGGANEAGCDGASDLLPPRDSHGSHRSLLRHHWKKCNFERNVQIVGTEIGSASGLVNPRHCCVKCKNVPSCSAWAFTAGDCKLFAPGTYRRQDVQGAISGTLHWRLK